ncbi:MAG: NifB/NifX family molybdenum-iron cluster-binding protein [Lutibacter sp.]|uniref:NifB/NifX family molybdenum-iron cluster-binding protein n=1 Tax=Lutibacter sp. TaxID=1925666 RepID=UPI00385D8C73
MKIAIPTNDRNLIAKRTGRAAEFAIYTIDSGEIKSVKYEKNTHNQDDHDKNEGHHHGENENHSHNGHNHEHGKQNHDELLVLLDGIDILFVRAVGKYMRKTLKNGSINYQLVKIDAISKILEDYLKSIN